MEPTYAHEYGDVDEYNEYVEDLQDWINNGADLDEMDALYGASYCNECGRHIEVCHC